MGVIIECLRRGGTIPDTKDCLIMEEKSGVSILAIDFIV